MRMRTQLSLHTEGRRYRQSRGTGNLHALIDATMNILLVDDSTAIRTQLGRMLARIPGVCVTAETGDEGQAISLVQSTQPDMVLLDLHLKPGSGMNVLRAIRAAGFDCQVLIVSNQFQFYYEQMAKECQADGYFDKSTQIEELLIHIRSIAKKRVARTAPMLPT
jgi:DNA-binding NarL/FixJ family response regulator